MVTLFLCVLAPLPGRRSQTRRELWEAGARIYSCGSWWYPLPESLRFCVTSSTGIVSRGAATKNEGAENQKQKSQRVFSLCLRVLVVTLFSLRLRGFARDPLAFPLPISYSEKANAERPAVHTVCWSDLRWRATSLAKGLGSAPFLWSDLQAWEGERWCWGRPSLI